MSRFQPDGWIITPKPEGLVRFVKEVFQGKASSTSISRQRSESAISIIMISDGGGLREPVSAFLYVYVENVDETYQRAVQAIELPSDLPYGDRRAVVKDRWGNLWQIASHKHGKQQP